MVETAVRNRILLQKTVEILVTKASLVKKRRYFKSDQKTIESFLRKKMLQRYLKTVEISIPKMVSHSFTEAQIHFLNS